MKRYLREIIGLILLAITLTIAGTVGPLSDAMRDAAYDSKKPVKQERLSHGRFENFTVYTPFDTPKGFVLLLSGSDGWTRNMTDLAIHLAQQGAMVAGLDTAQINTAFESDGGECVFPDGDLENLSHFVQAYFRLPTYLSPILAGYGEGATLAYATLTQAPKNTFAGAISWQFCPSYGSKKPLCKGSGLAFTPHADGKGVDFLPSKQPDKSWIVLQDQAGQACDAAAVSSFVAKVPGARLVTAPAKGSLPSSAGAHAAPLTWPPNFAAQFDTLMAQHPGITVGAVPNALRDLPLVTVPAQPTATPSDTFAIILSGDGGWAGLDKDVAGALAEAGIPVIGLDSLRYFWSARTPEGLAADLDRMTQFYVSALGKQRVMLIGYSQGADVLPFAVNRLTAATRSHIALTVVMGLSEHALFEFHMTSWVSDDNSGPATLPEVERIEGMPVLCIYGEGETDTLCPKLDPHKVTIVKLKGGHHFDGDYAGLARTILASSHR